MPWKDYTARVHLFLTDHLILVPLWGFEIDSCWERSHIGNSWQYILCSVYVQGSSIRWIMRIWCARLNKNGIKITMLSLVRLYRNSLKWSKPLLGLIHAQCMLFNHMTYNHGSVIVSMVLNHLFLARGGSCV